MLAFTLSVILFLMILPALLSVIFVTPSLKLLAWNLSWYTVMGFFGSIALSTPWGWCFGLIPAGIYLKRYFSVRRNGRQTVTFSHYRMKARAPSSEPAKSSNDSVVIEAEFTKDP